MPRKSPEDTISNSEEYSESAERTPSSSSSSSADESGEGSDYSASGNESSSGKSASRDDSSKSESSSSSGGNDEESLTNELNALKEDAKKSPVRSSAVPSVQEMKDIFKSTTGRLPEGMNDADYEVLRNFIGIEQKCAAKRAELMEKLAGEPRGDAVFSPSKKRPTAVQKQANSDEKKESPAKKKSKTTAGAKMMLVPIAVVSQRLDAKAILVLKSDIVPAVVEAFKDSEIKVFFRPMRGPTVAICRGWPVDNIFGLKLKKVDNGNASYEVTNESGKRKLMDMHRSDTRNAVLLIAPTKWLKEDKVDVVENDPTKSAFPKSWYLRIPETDWNEEIIWA